MRYTPDIQRLRADEQYDLAREVLVELVQRTVPRLSLLTELYGEAKAEITRTAFDRFIDGNARLFGIPRRHNDSRTDISDARSRMELKRSYTQLQLLLLQSERPDIALLRALYGDFAESVEIIFDLFRELGLRRKCGIPSVAHMNRVAAVIVGLYQADSERQLYCALGGMHDAVEDLINRVPHPDDGEVYGLKRYAEFINRYIPPELHALIRMLTNHYDLILDAVASDLRRRGRYIGIDNLRTTLEGLLGDSCYEVSPYIEKMYIWLEGVEEPEESLDTIKWICYKDLYIGDMARMAHVQRNYRPFEIKGIDLSDNAHGRDALSLDSRLKNMLKQQVWVIRGSRLHSDWHGVNKCIDELQEDVLVHAEHLIIHDLLQQQSPLDFIHSTFKKFEQLAPIFYTDREI